MYHLMAATVDSKKKTLFGVTKADLAKIFFSSIHLSDEEAEEEYPEKEKSTEDAVKFIRKIGYSPNPILLTSFNPDYMKYVVFFLEATKNETKSILLNNALQTDNNIRLTRFTNFVFSTATTIGWSLMDTKDREKMIVEAAVKNKALGLVYKRMDDGMSLSPDILTSAIYSSFGLFPTTVGLGYLLIDSIDEAMWVANTLKELEQLRDSYLKEKQVDPCEVSDVPDDYTLPDCKEVHDKLVDEVNKYE